MTKQSRQRKKCSKLRVAEFPRSRGVAEDGDRTAHARILENSATLARNAELRRKKSSRRGMSAMQAVISLAVTFPMTWVLYLMAEKSLGNLYQIISSIVGSPYL